MRELSVVPGTARRRLLVGLAACACLVIFSSAQAAVRALYVGGEFYPPNAATETKAKESGFNRLFLFTLHVRDNGDIYYNDTLVVSNGTYVGDSTWGTRLAAVKSDGRINRIEAAIGSYGSGAFDAIKSLNASQGTGPTSILYRNFLAFKNATNVDAFQYDDEGTYDVTSSVAFGKMLAGMGVKVTLCPYTAQSFWVSVRSQLGSTVDAIYLQCYDGGKFNVPSQWNTAFGGFKVFPGLWGNTSPLATTIAQMRTWQQTLGMNGGFMWLNGTLQYDANIWGDALKLSLEPTPYFLLVNKNSGKTVNLPNGNTANATPLSQLTYSYSDANQRWALLPTENSDHFKLLSWVAGTSACTVQDSVADGAQIHSYVYTGNNSAQQWDLVDAGNGYYKIRNTKSGKVLGVANASQTDNTNITQSSDLNLAHQLWRLQPQGDYYAKATSGRYVCVEGRGNSNGNRIIQYDLETNPWFLWRFQNVGDGNYRVSSLNALSRVLGVAGGATSAGTGCQLYDYSANNLGDQKVRLVPLTNGRYKFRFVHTSMIWDLSMGQTANNAPLLQNSENGALWQQFELERSLATLPVPAATGGLTGALVDGKATLGWNATAYAAGYNVKRATVPGGPYTTVASGVNATGYTDAGLALTGTYFYVVSAAGDSGEGVNSAEVRVTDSYQQWAQQNGLLPGAAGSGFAEDATGAGVANGIRYGVPGGLKVAVGTSTNALTFELRADASLRAMVQVSPDLVTWSAATVSGGTAGDQSGVGAGFTRMTFQDATVGTGSARFYRLQLSR